LLGVVVTPSVQERDGAKVLLRMFCHQFMRFLMIFADGGYAGKLEAFVRSMGALFGHGTSFISDLLHAAWSEMPSYSAVS
jgi:hypothetical protein